MTIINADYVSVWDAEDEVHTPCKWDTVKRIAFDIDTADEPDGANMLTSEYVELPNGIQIDVDSENETDEGIPAINPPTDDAVYKPETEASLDDMAEKDWALQVNLEWRYEDCPTVWKQHVITVYGDTSEEAHELADRICKLLNGE